MSYRREDRGGVHGEIVRSTASPKWSRAVVGSPSARSWSSATARAESAPAWERPARSRRRSAKGSRRPRSTWSPCPWSGPRSRTRCVDKLGAAKVLFKPGVARNRRHQRQLDAGRGRAAGIHDIITKSLGTNNPINMVRATVAALASLRTLADVAQLRGRLPKR